MAPLLALDYLEQKNAAINAIPVIGINTSHENWSPIEGIRPLLGFEYLKKKFKKDLRKDIKGDVPSDIANIVKNMGLDVIKGEDSVVGLVTVANMLPVNMALHACGHKETKILHGSKFSLPGQDFTPDLGICADTKIRMQRSNQQAHKSFCPIDIKVAAKWSGSDILDMADSIKWESYPDDPQLVNLLRPLEQIQHYCTMLKCRWGAIITDDELFIIRVTKCASPRASRTLRPRFPITSARSSLSSEVERMSIATSSAYSTQSTTNVEWLECISIPAMPKRGQMTINLALFLLSLYTAKGHELGTSYEPLDPDLPPLPQTLSSIVESQTFSMDSSQIDEAVIKHDLQIYCVGARHTSSTYNGQPIFEITFNNKPNIEWLDVRACLESDSKKWWAIQEQWKKNEDRYDYAESYVARRRWKVLFHEI